MFDLFKINAHPRNTRIVHCSYKTAMKIQIYIDELYIQN